MANKQNLSWRLLWHTQVRWARRDAERFPRVRAYPCTFFSMRARAADLPYLQCEYKRVFPSACVRRDCLLRLWRGDGGIPPALAGTTAHCSPACSCSPKCCALRSHSPVSAILDSPARRYGIDHRPHPRPKQYHSRRHPAAQSGYSAYWSRWGGERAACCAPPHPPRSAMPWRQSASVPSAMPTT